MANPTPFGASSFVNQPPQQPQPQQPIFGMATPQQMMFTQPQVMMQQPYGYTQEQMQQWLEMQNQAGLQTNKKFAGLGDFASNTIAVSEQTTAMLKSQAAIQNMLSSMANLQMFILQLIEISRNQAIRNGNSNESATLDSIAAGVNAMVTNMNLAANEVNITTGGRQYSTNTMYFNQTQSQQNNESGLIDQLRETVHSVSSVIPDSKKVTKIVTEEV